MVSTEGSLVQRMMADFETRLLVGVDSSETDDQRSKKVSVTLFAPVSSFGGTFRVTLETAGLFDFLLESHFGAGNLS